jgi:hypothetical protein
VAAVISAPDSLAWLLNIRGGDVPRTPFALGYAIIDKDGKVDLFIDPRKLTAEARQHLGNEVAVQPKSGFLPALDALGKDRFHGRCRWMTAGVAIYDRLNAAGAKPAVGEDPCALPRPARIRSRYKDRAPRTGATARRSRNSCTGCRSRRPRVSSTRLSRRKSWRRSAVATICSATSRSTPSRPRAERRHLPLQGDRGEQPADPGQLAVPG